MRRRALWAWLAAACVAAFIGCGQSEGDAAEAEGEVLPPRWARSFLPVGSSWVSEADIPEEPQQTPRMVIWELSEVADRREASAEEHALADDLVARSWEAAERHGWFDFQTGITSGYRLLHGDKRHYYHEAYLFDGITLDPNRPEFLMYYGTPQGQKLAGLMFYAPSPQARGPQIGGPLTVWHYHIWASANCLLRGLLLSSGSDADGRCARGEPLHRSPEMMHVWLLDHPEGPFATSMWLQPEQLKALIERDERREAGRRAQP